MALQASAGLLSLSPPQSAAGLRRPTDRYALKSAFFSPSVHLLLSPSQRASVATAPKFSMRVTSKQAYICRDCGYIYNDRTPFEKLPDNYFCPGECALDLLCYICVHLPHHRRIIATKCMHVEQPCRPHYNRKSSDDNDDDDSDPSYYRQAYHLCKQAVAYGR